METQKHLAKRKRQMAFPPNSLPCTVLVLGWADLLWDLWSIVKTLGEREGQVSMSDLRSEDRNSGASL